MGQTYRENYSENDDILVPDFFIEDMSALAGELNGGLDRDNFAQADIVAGDVSSRPFTRVNHSDTPESSYTATMTTTEWQGGVSGVSRINYSSWTSVQPVHMDLHWTGQWTWTGAWSWTPNGLGRPDTINTTDTITFRMVADGVVVATAGPFDDACRIWSASMVASFQAEAGPHIVKVEAELCRRVWQSGKVAGICTNTLTVPHRILTVLERFA